MAEMNPGFRREGEDGRVALNRPNESEHEQARYNRRNPRYAGPSENGA
jgi:hypothetical protein